MQGGRARNPARPAWFMRHPFSFVFLPFLLHSEALSEGPFGGSETPVSVQIVDLSFMSGCLEQLSREGMHVCLPPVLTCSSGEIAGSVPDFDSFLVKNNLT